MCTKMLNLASLRANHPRRVNLVSVGTAATERPLAEPVMASGSNTHLAGAFAAAAILTSVCQSAASSASAFVWDVTKTPGCLLGLAAARLLATTGTSPTPAKTEQRQQPFKVAAAPLELQRKPSQPGELQLELPQLPSSQKQQQLGSSQFKAAAAFKRPSLKPSISSTRKTSALSSPTSAKAAVHWAAKGMAAEHDCQLREALACYQKAVDLAPDSVIHLCALAKAWSDLSYEEGMPEAERLELNRKAVEIADKIVAMNPTHANGWIMLAVTRGRLSLFLDNKQKVKLAKGTYESVLKALALDPSNSVAHHLLGMWNAEMSNINFVQRQLVKVIYGSSLAPGNLRTALAQFEHAMKLAPHKLVHRAEVGRTLFRLGRKAEAYHHLVASLSMEVDDINAKLQKKMAEELLSKHKAEFERALSSSSGSSSEASSQAPSAAESSSDSSSSSYSSVFETDDTKGMDQW